MEASPSSHLHRFQYPPSQQPSTRSSLPSNHHQLRHHGGFDGFRSAMRFLTLQRITANSISIPLNRSYPNIPVNDPLSRICFNIAMADSDDKKELQSIDKRETEKSTEEIPPPPEKPLPGDCCGSGCVRCVWDVYYEELEEYNKVYKSKSEAKISSKSS